MCGWCGCGGKVDREELTEEDIMNIYSHPEKEYITTLIPDDELEEDDD